MKKLMAAFAMTFIAAFLPSFLSSQPKAVFDKPSIDTDDTEGHYIGFRINPGRVTIRGLKGEKVTLITWVAGNNDEWQENRHDEIEVKSDPFVIPSGSVTHFFGDMYLTDIYGKGTQDLKFSIMLTHETHGTLAEKMFTPGKFALGKRTTGIAKKDESWEAQVIRRYYPWNAAKKKEVLLQPYQRSVVMKPQGSSYFAFTYAVNLPSDSGELVSMRYLNDGNRIIVSDENSFVYLIDINSGDLIWKQQIVPRSRLSMQIFDVSPDNRFFLCGQAQWVVGSDPSLKICDIETGRVVKELNENTQWYDMTAGQQTMRCASAHYESGGKTIRAVWRNARLAEAMYDLNMKSYDSSTLVKRWEWQILDPETLDSNNEREYHMDISVFPDSEKQDHFYLFSRTDKVYYLTTDTIKQAMTVREPDKKARPEYLYKMPYVAPGTSDTWLRGMLPSGKKNIYWGAFTDKSGEGSLALTSIKTGAVTHRTVWPMMISGIKTAGNGRYLVSRGENMIYLWDTPSRYLIWNAWIGTGAADINPRKKEIAVVEARRIRFAIERPAKKFKIGTAWQEVDIHLDPDAAVYAYTDSHAEYGMHRKSNGEPRKTAFDYMGEFNQINMRHDKHWMSWLAETGERGTKLMVRCPHGGCTLETWGGLTETEYRGTVKSIRDRLPGW